MFLYEGAVYALISVVAGVLMSIPVAYTIIWGFSEIINGTGMSDRPFDIISYFDFTLSSIFISITAGFLIALITIFFTTFKISRLNIVRAIRNIPEPPPEKKDKRMFIIGISGIALGMIMFAFSFPTNLQALFYPGISLVIFGLAIVFRRFVSERISYTVGSFLVLVLWSLPFDLGFDGEMEMFVMSGIFMVAAAVIALVYNFTSVVRVFNNLFKRVHRSVRPILKMAVAYPTQSRLKTGLMVFIFTINPQTQLLSVKRKM